ncbi:formimidoylglutamase [Nonlabens xiamenensis]|uniref:formimidoylglutamase n=1 Tax=Nonlabens xiamenensis TaxID=2341043 RepID=UPI000F613A0E|nr:formimidoylglutamase [Nonlabens xiamenensis]
MMKYLKPFTQNDLQHAISRRYDLTQEEQQPEDQAICFAQKIQVLEQMELESIDASYVLMGIPEDIGVRANMGRAGAAQAWEAFLKTFLSLQHSPLNDATRFAMLGQVETADLMKQAESLDAAIHNQRIQLSHLTATLDQRVSEVVSQIGKTDKIPVIIGGGHNNAYPIIRALGDQRPIDVINIDAHTDLRVGSGRHSGNGFRKALEEGYLRAYYMLGIQEAYLSQPMIQLIEEEDRLGYSAYQINYHHPEQMVKEALEHVDSSYFGLEVDMDVVANFPSSAQSPVGYDINQLRQVIKTIIEEADELPKYIHICEAAPKFGYPGQVGKALAMLVSDLP